jgi:hypothetical protein
MIYVSFPYFEHVKQNLEVRPQAYGFLLIYVK